MDNLQNYNLIIQELKLAGDQFFQRSGEGCLGRGT